MSITLNKASSDYLKGIKLVPITKWVQVNSIKYLRNFFSSSKITPDSITKSSFVNDGFDRFLPIAQVFVYDVFPVKICEFVRMIASGGKYADCVTGSYRQAKQFYAANKNRPMDDTKKGSPSVDQYLNGAEFNIGRSNREQDCLMDVILHWSDTFSSVKERLVAACDYILNNFVDAGMVSSDLAQKKFPMVVDFFNLDKPAEELMKFCYTFRATGLKLPRDVQNFEDRMRQLSELTKVDIKDIQAFAEVYKKSKQFLPFIVETVSVQDNVWAFLANERADSLEDCFYKVLKTDDALPRTFFDKLDEDNTDTIIKLINGDAVKNRPRHILLYGKPGTGKTSYMKLISKLSGRKAYVITQAAPTENQRNREYDTEVESRFMSITICDERVDSKKSIIIVDEADEMINCSQPMLGGFGFGGGQTYDTHIKSLLNQVMDNVETPVIWITNNHPGAIDPSCRRRFDYSIFFDDFNEKQRNLIWKNNVKRFKLGKLVTQTMIDELAAEYAVTPGGIATACQDLLDINPSKNDVYKTLTKVLDKHCELLCIPSQKKMNEKFRPVKNYSLDGLNIESMIPLKEVEEICANYLEKKANGDVERGLCMLLSGPSGTGKTEFCKYLGSILKKNVRVVRGSTVLDKYVGETEQKIAHEFKMAEDSDTILFMDEIDGLLGGRERTQHSWEVSQVNEILQQMENFRGIFIAATNFSENLDNASTRRFAFKFKFDYLNADGIIEFYKRYFGRIDSKNKFYDKLKNMHMVAPGDFAVVKMLSEYTKDKITAEWVYNSIKREVDAKKGNNGFKSVKPKNLGY